MYGNILHLLTSNVSEFYILWRFKGTSVMITYNTSDPVEPQLQWMLYLNNQAVHNYSAPELYLITVTTSNMIRYTCYNTWGIWLSSSYFVLQLGIAFFGMYGLM